MTLKSLFWKGDDGDEPEPPAEQAGESAVLPPLPKRPTHAPAGLAALRSGPSASLFERTTGMSGLTKPASHAGPIVDPKFNAAINELLDQDSKEPGFREFVTQFTALSGIIPDRKQCASAALAAVTAANSRLDAIQIARAIGERLQLLVSYESSYQDDANKREQAENNDKSKAISETRQRIQELDAELARLQGERAQLVSEAETLQQDLSGVTQKYDGHRDMFRVAADGRREELKQLLNFVAPGAK